MRSTAPSRGTPMTIEMDHFIISEFDCKCGCACRGSMMDSGVLRKLDLARERAGVPFKITSGVRCAAHNEREGGKPNSAHLVGLAADIAVQDSRKRFDMVQALFGVGFHRLGIGHSWIHVDDDESKPPEVMWLY